MTEQEIKKRQLSFRGKSLKEIKQCNSVITVAYASYEDVLIFNADDLSDVEKIDLVNSLIRNIQSESNFTREIVKRIGDVFFVS